MRVASRSNRGGRDGRNRRLQLLIFPVMALLMAGALFLVLRYMTGETLMKTEEPVYQYFLDQKVEYDEGTVVIPGENGIVFGQGDDRSAGDVTPVYSADSEALMLPIDMSWMDPTTKREWRVPALSRLERDENGDIWYVNGDDRIYMDGGFLSSGRGTYVFLDTVSLQFGGMSYDLEPFSCYYVANGMYRIYRYQNDELAVETTSGGNTSVRADKGYRADLTVGNYTAADGSLRLLAASPSLLKEIGER
ncbi:MAG: hypothetical protein PUB51_03255 [Oscillospiraceae bacterium]|nr:hypothetical protein [Oscillospiraceae bacterium]